MVKRGTFVAIVALTAALFGGWFVYNPAVAQEVCDEREVSDFSAIEINDTGTLVITQGDTPSLTVCVAEDEENWEGNILTETRGGTLHLGQGAGFLAEVAAVAQEVDITYQVTVPSLTLIDAAGIIDINIDGFQADSLELVGHQGASYQITGLTAENLTVDLHDRSDATISGTTSSLVVDTDDAAEANLLQLEAMTAMVDTLEASTAAIRVVESATGEAHSFSTVEVMTENGTVDVDTSLLGEVINLPYEPLAATPVA